MEEPVDSVSQVGARQKRTVLGLAGVAEDGRELRPVRICIGWLTGPPGANPTKAATEVPTPSMGFDVAGISST